MLTKISLKKLIDTPVAGDKMPSHAIIASDDKYENKTTVGKLWFKKGEHGNYLSGELSKPFKKDDATQLEGYVILSTKEYNSLKGNTPDVSTGEANVDEIDF